jgi:ribose transport system permease protein
MSVETDRHTGRGVDSPSPNASGQWRSRLAASSVLWIGVALLGLIVVFSVATPSGTFLSVFNLQTLANDASVVLILAAGATFVIVAGGLDLSIGSVMTVSAVVSVLVMKGLAGSDGTAAPWLAIAVGSAAGLAVGVLWGALNGVLIAYLRLSPFVVTLGSLGAALGAARLLSGGSTETGSPPELQQSVGLAFVAEIPVPFIVGVAALGLLGLILSLTRFGERTYLIGSNEVAARRGGLKIERHLLMIYTLSGATAGLAGLVDVARFAGASVTTGHVTELIAAIAAVIIGGASLTGGVGVMAGTFVGVLIPTILNNGLIILGFQRFWQDIAIGIVLVVAVAFGQWQRGRDERLAYG